MGHAVKTDLNCDLGEGMEDALILPFITSANIATGFHAGDHLTMLRCIRLCRQYEVHIGAHPSFPDRAHFGREEMHLASEELYALVACQVGAIQALCRSQGTVLRHVKPHGALYNMSAKDPEIARTIALALLDIDDTLILFGLAGSISVAIAREMGLPVMEEAFADRAYLSNGQLVPRSQPGAVHGDVSSSLQQARDIAFKGQVRCIDGTTISLKADSICLHGDSAGAVALSELIWKALKQ